jgi:hypothetical protein
MLENKQREKWFNVSNSLLDRCTCTPPIQNYKMFWVFSHIAFVVHIDVLSRHVAKTIYPEKPKRLIIWSEEVIKQYLIFISQKIIARARAWVDGLVFGLACWRWNMILSALDLLLLKMITWQILGR